MLVFMSPILFRPLITVVIAVYNRIDTLQQCIDSVSSQTLQETELIIIDGGSTDGTVELLTANATRLGYWISEPDKGIYNAWNKALRHANGEWICFLGADDYLWSNDAFAQMAVALKALPNATQIAYGRIMLLGLDGALLYTVGEPYDLKRRQRVDVMGLPPHPGLMHRRSVFEERGGFDENFRIAGDTELLLRELQRSSPCFIPEIIVAGMRQGGISSKPSNVFKSLIELRHIQRKYGMRWPGIPLTLTWMRVSVRWVLWAVMGERLARRLLDFGRKLLGKPTYWTRT